MMGLGVRLRGITRVAVLDDDESARKALEFGIVDAGFEAVSESAPLRDVTAFVQHVRTVAHAAVCDHHLRKKNYATFDGAEVVALLYQAQVPALLCTGWEDARIVEIRRHRRFIPILLKPVDLSPEAIRAGLAECLAEFGLNFSQSRKPWRTLVRIEEVEDRVVFLVVPGWNPKEVIRLALGDLPAEIAHSVKPGMRLHAQVNLGATRHEDLYFYDWEPP